MMRNALVAVWGVFLASSAMAQVTFDSSFECGNATGFTEVSPGLYEFEIEPDTNSTDRQWYSFEVNGASGQTLTFRLIDTNQTNVPSHWSTAVPVYTSDGGTTWQRLGGVVSSTSTTYTFQHTFTADSVRFAFHYPYTTGMVAAKLSEWTAHEDASAVVIGQSAQGRDLHHLTITDESAVPADGKIGVWVVTRQHAAEVTGNYTLEGLVDYALSDTSGGRALRAGAVLNVIPMANPDGVVAGNYRDNSQGVNLNRVWNGTASPTNGPEIQLIQEVIQACVDAGEDYTLFLDLHSTSGTNPHYAYHPSVLQSSQSYYDEAKEFLASVRSYAPNFNDTQGMSTSTDTRIADDSNRVNYGVLSFTFEGAYNNQNFGPNSGSYMTREIHRNVGEAIARTIVDHYGLTEETSSASAWGLY